MIRYTWAALAALIFATACHFEYVDDDGCTAPSSYGGDDGGCNPPPIASATEGDTEGMGDTVGEGAASWDDGADVTGGDSCNEGEVVYTCRGWIAGLHKHVNPDPDPSRRVIRSMEAGETIKYWHSCRTVDVLAPFVGADKVNTDTEEMFQLCREKCEEEKDGVVFANTDADWYHVENVCMFGPNGYDTNGASYAGGEVPAALAPPDANGTVGDNSGVDCPNVAPGVQQVYYNGDLTEAMHDGDACHQESCSDGTWNPAADIAYSTNSITKVVTTTMPRSLLEAVVYDGEWQWLYECDIGRYTFTGFNHLGAEQWKMKNLSSSDNGLLYEMGFRTDDKLVKIRRNVVGSTWYSLATQDGMSGAYVALSTYNSFIVEFTRGGVTWTMTLTLN